MRRGRGENFVVEESAPPTLPLVADSSPPKFCQTKLGRGILRNHNKNETCLFRETCRICLGSDLEKILDLGVMPLANGFLPKSKLKAKERAFPLAIYFCPDCGLLQLRHVVNPKILFKNYLYQTGASSPLVAHFKKLAQKIIAKHIDSKNDLVVEIGSNDGSLLENIKSSAKILGVDPAPSMAKIAEARGVPTLTAFFNRATAEKVLKSQGGAKVIIANNVIAHIDDLHDVFAAIKTLLSPGGKFIFEVHWVGNLLGRGGFDQIYHEHLCYFSLHALRRLARNFGLEILNVSLLPIHGQSLRVTAGQTGSANKSVKAFLKKEKKLGLEKKQTYLKFAAKVKKNRDALLKLLKRLKKAGKKIAGYGAPAKGNTLLNYCGITAETLDFITDTTPFKQGLYTPGTHIPILGPETLLTDTPDFVLLLSWNYEAEILKKEKVLRTKGLKFILPVPAVRVV